MTMRHTITTILAALLALAIVAPASATVGQADDPPVVVWMHTASGQVWMATSVPAGSAAEARTLIAMTDAAFVESTFGGIVIADEALSAMALRNYSANAGHMYGVLMDTGSSAVITILAVGPDVYIFAVAADDLSRVDSEGFVSWMRAVVVTGMDAPAPAGFVRADRGALGGYAA